MGKLIFGKDESIECIQPVKLKGAEHEELCIAYKTTTLFVGAGVYMKDDGYVLAVSKNYFYPLPSGSELKEFQSTGMLPDPLPEYSVPLWKYGLGYSLWLIIGLVVAFTLWSSARKKKRLREDAEAPLSAGPPALDTDRDRALADVVRPLLKANEQVEQQAFGFPEPLMVNGELAPGDKGAHGVLTNQRVLFVHLVSNKPHGDVLEIIEQPRPSLAGVVSDDGLMHFYFADGSVRLLWVRRKEKGFSNQVRFIRDLPKLFPVQAAAESEATAAA